MNNKKAFTLFSLTFLLPSIFISGCDLLPGQTPQTVDITQEVEVVTTRIVEITKEIIITSTALPTQMPSPLPQIFFEEDFTLDNGKWKFDLESDDPNAYYRYINGELELGIAQDRSKGEIIFNHPAMEGLDDGYDLSFDAKLVEGDERYTTFGVNIRDNHFSRLKFSFTQTGLYRLAYFVEDEWQDVISWTREPAIKPEGFNTIHIMDDGTQVKVYANSELLFNIPVQLPPVGLVNFFMEVLTDQDTKATLVEGTWALDNVIIRAIE
jgi:hypothetical protein